MTRPDRQDRTSEVRGPIPEQKQDVPEIVETDELLDFREFEDEEYLGAVEAPMENGSMAGESEQ